MRVLDRLAVAALAASVAACSTASDVSYPTRQLFDVHIAVWSPPSFAADRASDGSPTADCNIILLAHATGEGSAQWQDATFYWYMGVDRTRPVDSTTASVSDVHGSWANAGISRTQDERGGWQLAAGLPFDLKIVYRYELNTSHRVRSDSVRLMCGPAVPTGGVPFPTLPVAELLPHSGPWQLGDTLGVHFQASSAAGLWLTYVQTTGALHADSLVAEQMANTADRSPRFPIPQSAAIDTSIVADVYAVDVFGQAVRATLATSPVLDLVPPSLYDTASAPTFPAGTSPLAGAYFVGDTMHISANATDNHGLRTLGWRGMPGGHADSIAGYDTVFHGMLRIPVPSAWLGTPQLSFTATDLAGNTTTITPATGAFTVYPTLSRPVDTAVVGHQTGAAVIDTGLSTVYVVQTDTNRIVELSVPGLQRRRTFALPAWLTSMDVTPSGDSLVMTLGGHRALYFLDLRQAAPQLTMMPLTLDSADGQGPVAVRVAANDRAYVGTSGATVYQSQILEVDLATGAQRIRNDAGSVVGLLGRSLDQSVIFVAGSCVELLYAATDSFGPCTSAPASGEFSADARGDRLSVGFDVFDSTITLLRQTTDPIPPWGQQPSTALSADGAYLDESIPSEGLVRVRVSDGALMDRALIPSIQSFAMQIAPDGTWALLRAGYVPSGVFDVATVDLRDADAQPVQFARAPSRTGASLLRAPARVGRPGVPSKMAPSSWNALTIRPRAVPVRADALPSASPTAH